MVVVGGLAVGGQRPIRILWDTADGVMINPLKPSKGTISVAFFVLSDCPIANGYAPEVGRIMTKYQSKGIQFSVVYVDSKLSAPAVKAHAKAYGYSCPLVLDPTHSLAKQAGATVSPEVVVVGGKGLIEYRGRIDDRAVEIGKLRPRPTRQDLRLTLDALLAGKPVPVAKTKAVGCLI